ncbi:hypothetical protein TNCV_5083251 [Trichonephila clavipes]|nr:hypothetical protein TNCV_5083251 [Trichonephila clavipes]
MSKLSESTPPIRLHHFLYYCRGRNIHQHNLTLQGNPNVHRYAISYCGPKSQFQRQIGLPNDVRVNLHIVVKRQRWSSKGLRYRRDMKRKYTTELVSSNLCSTGLYMTLSVRIVESFI